MGQVVFPIKTVGIGSAGSRYNQVSGKRKFTLTSVLLQLIFLGVSIFMLYNVGRSVYLASAKLAILDQAEHEVEQLRLENISLVLKSDEAGTDDYVEKQARDRLNYAREGETQCVIPDSLLESYVGSESTEEVLGSQSNSQSNEEASFDVWWKFFTDGI